MDDFWIAYTPTYNDYFVILSLIVACIATTAAFFINDQVKKNTLLSRTTWIMIASMMLGVGIWSVHFIGMIAMQMPFTLVYSKVLTIVTIIPAIIASLIAFYYINQPRHTWERAMISGFFIGTGIVVMHYGGMFAMNFEGVRYSYKYEIVAISYIIASLLSVAALLIYRYLYVRRGYFLSRFTPAMLLACAVVVAHYMGMEAIVYETNAKHTHIHSAQEIDLTFIYLGIGSSLTIIVGLILATLIINRVFSRRLEYYDSLTGLPNLMQFTKQLENDYRAHSLAAVKFERMTEGSSNYGLLFDEQLLKSLATKLKSHLPDLTELYRVHDYTFVLVAQDELASKQMANMLEHYLRELGASVPFQDQVFKVPAVAAMTKAETLAPFKELYNEIVAVLEHPSTNYNFSLTQYNPLYHTHDFEASLLKDLDEAMQNGDIFVVYQPKINPHTNEFVSTEALIRWVHPQHGFLAPPVFLKVLEEHERLQDLTDWIIEKVCQQLAEWQKEKLVPQVGINIPGPYLTASRLFEQVVAMTEKYGIDRHMLELEITETSVVHSIQEATEAVLKFRNEGFEVALDDFGTGVSSLSYLKQLACSTLKIDKSFVDGILESDKDKAILEAIVSLGKSLHMQIVIEGVEHQEQVDYLMGLNEHLLIQGYYYAKPMKPAELAAWHKQYEVVVN